MKRCLIFVSVAAVCLASLWVGSSFAALTEKQWSLSEIKRVSVFVQGLTEAVQKRGLTNEQIKADVEPVLQQIGIKAVSQEEAAKLPGSPVLYVNLSAYKRERVPAYVYHVDIGLLQKVGLVRAPAIQIMSITWNKGRLGHCPSEVLAKSVSETVKYLMDKFSKDYAAANPNRQQR